MLSARRVFAGIAFAVVAGACSSPDTAVGSAGTNGPANASPLPGGGGTTSSAPATSVPPQHDPTPAPSANGTVETLRATSLGTTAFSANGRVQPHGRPTQVWFEYGKTDAYGQRTEAKPLGPKRTAHYAESWNAGGTQGFYGGIEAQDLTPVPTGGTGDSGFVRFSEPSDYDSNHVDGVGFLQLTQYVYVGTVTDERFPSAAWGGGDPDLRDAQITVKVRGNDFSRVPAELTFWAQSDIDLSQQNDEFPIRANWAHTGFSGMDLVWRGGWQTMAYTLEDDTNAWSFGGWSLEQVEAFGRNRYPYAPIDYTLRHVNCDLMHVLTQVRADQPPLGSIDYDDYAITYRNHSVLIPSNGGKLVSFPAGGTGESLLTDGWRNGDGHMWRSAPSPSGAQELVYALDLPVTISAVQLHQHPDWPSKDVEVLVSPDGATWSTLLADVVPDASPAGPNHTFLLQCDLEAVARFVKVRILSGYRPEYWGLGEIEVFGTGAVEQTDDDWYTFSADVTELEPGATYHYRMVSSSSAGTVYGGDKIFVVPTGAVPEVQTGKVTQASGGTARIDGRINPLGHPTLFVIEYGDDPSYGTQTVPAYAGSLDMPRTVIADLEGLVPGKTYHYRLVAFPDPDSPGSPFPTTNGVDATFVAQ